MVVYFIILYPFISRTSLPYLECKMPKNTPRVEGALNLSNLMFKVSFLQLTRYDQLPKRSVTKQSRNKSPGPPLFLSFLVLRW